MSNMPGTPNAEECSWASYAHFAATLFGWLGALIVWLMKKGEMPFVNDQGKEALNFQITMVIGYVVLQILAGFISASIGYLVLVLWLVSVVLTIMGGLAAKKGQAYRYPFALRLIK